MTSLSVESQKGINAVQRYFAENKKGTIAVQSLWQSHPSASQWNIIEKHLSHSKVLVDLNEFPSIFEKVQHSHARHHKTTSNLLRIH